MSPKEKAIELYNKLYDTSSHPHHIETRQQIAKQCALIAVDEILNLNHIITFRRNMREMEYEFWQEVKQEIKKL